MSFHYEIDENDDAGHAASTHGWAMFIDWAETLDLEKYEEVIRFAEHGQSTDIQRLETELSAALANSAPDDSTVKSTAKNLLKTIRNNAYDEGSYIIITDGATDVIEDGDEGGPDEDADDEAAETAVESSAEQRRIEAD
jgi:hypothetical protein